MKCNTERKGFSLVELMIVIAIVAILVALALPSYSSYIRKANRAEAQQLLLNWSNNQELWRANHTTYAIDGAISPPTHDKYKFAASNTTSTTFTLTATPSTPDQLKDKQFGDPCTSLTLTQSNAKSPAKCWNNSGS
jgi:type IV pilus assembly protein PilE